MPLLSPQAGFLITNALRFMFNAPGVTSWQYTLLQLQARGTLSSPLSFSVLLPSAARGVSGFSLNWLLCFPSFQLPGGWLCGRASLPFFLPLEQHLLRILACGSLFLR